uniref:Uncharacterized protein LOC114341636 n=1 Tax=Diabrotica virgifera virgifera TaxID=50390 RepID=A0A6P7GWQ2_DIAVI
MAKRVQFLRELHKNATEVCVPRNDEEFLEVENLILFLVENITQHDSTLKRREPVKLTMKQGLIMNQVILTYGLTNVKNSLCKRHIEEFKSALRAFEPWALQMFDASSKLSGGILGGNLYDYGAFTQCINIYKHTDYAPIRGKQCGLQVNPPEKLMKIILGYRNVSEKMFYHLKNHVMDDVALVWSVCVPDSCPAEEILRHFNKSIVELTEGLNLTVDLSEKQCFSLVDQPKIDIGDIMAIGFLGSIVAVVLGATTVDYINE